jgi:Predicted transcriptional regulators
MIENDITLEELSQRTGVEARTLRSWVSEGLLAPPFKPGRGARYPASNADRALAVRLLKDGHGLSLAEISHRFVMATEDQIRQWARETSMTSVKPGSARAYLSGLKRRASTPADVSSPVIRSSESYSSIQHMDRQFSIRCLSRQGRMKAIRKCKSRKY